MLKKLKKWLLGLCLGSFIADITDDILILSGLTCIVGATFLLNFIAGFYVLGVCLFGLGVWFAKNPIRKG